MLITIYYLNGSAVQYMITYIISDKLKDKHLSQISRRIPHSKWQFLTHEFLKVDLSDFAAFLEVALPDPKVKCLSMLRIWRNTNYPEATIGNLQGIMSQAVEEHLVDREVLTEMEEMIGKP